MTTLMLQELNDAQIDQLDSKAPPGNDVASKDNPWNPERKPSQPAIRPWWQRQAPVENDSPSCPEPLWGRGSGPS